MPAKIGHMRVTLSADTAAFHSGMKRAEAQAKTSAGAINKSLGVIKAGFAGFVAGLSVGMIANAIRGALDYAGSLGEVSQQLGVTTRELQIFRFAVQQNGGTVENADQALGKFAIAISKAQSGSKQAAAAFAAAGVSLNDLATKSKTELLGQIADRFKATGGASANAAAGVAIFGRGFQKIIPVLDQGSEGLSQLAAAADELGIVLSDDQIQNADRTADKLDALKTVLSAKIAGTVADNADSILMLAEALLTVAAAAGKAIGEVAAFVNFLARNPAAALNPAAAAGTYIGNQIANSGNGNVRGYNKAGKSVTVALGAPSVSSAPTGSPTRFLGGGGGGRNRPKPDDAERKRLEALRDALRIAEDQRRMDIDILRAKQDLAHSEEERYALEKQILDIEQISFNAALEYQVQAKELTKAQADELRLKNDQLHVLRYQAALEEEELQRQRGYNLLDERDYERKLARLELEANLAETAKERRTAELKILDLAHQEERNRLERIIRESKDWAEIEAARRELLDLTKRQGLERQGVMNQTQGPLEGYLNSLPGTAAKWDEALQGVAVNGLQSVEDGLVNILTGTQSVAEAFRQMAASIIADLIRIQIQKMILNLVGSIGGIPGGGAVSVGGFASGGFTGNIGRNRVAGVVHGNEFVLNANATKRLGVPNLNALNSGAPLSAVSNDNSGDTMVGGDTFNITLPRGMSAYEGRQTGRQIERGRMERMKYGMGRR